MAVNFHNTTDADDPIDAYPGNRCYTISSPGGKFDRSQSDPMPSTFDDFGLRFLYPDNWNIQSRESDETSEGVTLEMPRGGFYTVTKYRDAPPLDVVLEKFATTLRAEYPEIEAEEVGDRDDDDSETLEFRFYYLDLLIVARVMAMSIADQTLVIHIQAESHEFDAGEKVFDAMLKSIRDGLTK